MLVMKENERLYLSTWEYNAAQILTELATIITNNGGIVQPLHKAIISNRAVDRAINEYQEKIDLFTEMEKTAHNETRTAAKEKVADLKKINNEPITVTHTSYIRFTLNGYMYYYQVDSNPFFEFYYNKTPIVNGMYSLDSCICEDKKEWLFDCFFYNNCSKEDIKEAANLIFNMLVSAGNTPIMRDKKRQRVPNTYNSGYHYETVYSPERKAKVENW